MAAQGLRASREEGKKEIDMQLGVYTNTEELQKTRPWTYVPKGYEPEPGEPMPTLHLRPWTRTTQGVVEKRAKARGVTPMDIDDALKGVGTKDPKAEAYVRELADFLIADWTNVAYGTDIPEMGIKKGDALPCVSENKVFLFEDLQVAVDIIDAARSFATVQIKSEAKNAERSSGGAESRENSQNRTSA
jgi:hypothetical protein